MDKKSDYLPLVSVITVCFNAQRYLERAMRSVFAQKYPKIEYIIVDACSTDATPRIIEKYRERIGRLVSEPDQGIYDAQNKGIRLSKGEIICLLNSDDQFYSPESVAGVVRYFARHDLDLVYGNILNTSPDGAQVYLVKFPRVLKKRFFLRGPLGHPSTFYKRSCFDKAGFFDLRYKSAADYDWALRGIYGCGLKAGYLGETLSIFQEGGHSKNELDSGKETRSVINSHFTLTEIFFGRLVNFFAYGDILRVFARLILFRKGYNALRSAKRKINAYYYRNVKANERTLT